MGFNYDNLTALQKAGFTALGLAILIFFGITDFITGPELSFSIFYLIPIFVSTWLSGFGAGIFLSLAGAVIWAASDILSAHGYSHFLIPYWNAFVRLSFFVIFSYMLSKIRQGWDREKVVSRIDYLTGALNARSFYDFVDLEIGRARRRGRVFSIAYIDLDNFKSVNDSQGHSVGDDVLRVAAELMRESFRKEDTVARLGGDEFAALLPETGEKEAVDVVERARRRLLEAMKANGWPVTFSIGICAFQRPPTTVNEATGKADQLIYQVKKSGKNSVKIEVA